MAPSFLLFFFPLFGLILEVKNNNISAICGKTEFGQKLISKGTTTEKGEFPFAVAMYLLKESIFICGGSLISQQHILTAAHCLRDHGHDLSPEDLIISLGAYDLTSRIEKSAIKRDVLEIHIHPDWYAYNEKHDADLAILVLSEMVTFTNYIRPVCMPPDNSVVASSYGTIVGWGLTENGTQPHLKYPKQGVTIALNDSHCYTIDSEAARISSLRTFCGSGGSSSPNRGDSGGGFFVRYGTAWVQYGIVSAIRSDTTGSVDPNSISIYTNVNVFKKWIIDTVRQSGGQVGEANGQISQFKIELECQYFDEYGSEVYGCRLQNLDIRSENIEVVSITGSHTDGKTDLDVKLLQFTDGTAIYLPDGIGKFFKNVIKLKIQQSRGTKFIRRSNFKNLDSLDTLYIGGNDIEALKEDCLWDLPKLEYFILADNKLRKLEENTFAYNAKLKEINLNKNQLQSIPGNLFWNNSQLEVVDLRGNSLNFIDEKTFLNNSKLKKVYLTGNQFDVITTNIFQNNSLLELVSLSKNHMKLINENIFTNNSELREVYLYNNELEFVHKNLFQNNSQLKIVWLQINNLKTIDKETFVNNPELKRVYLHNNKLDFIPEYLFRNNFVLRKILLNDNSLKMIHEDTFANNLKLNEVYLNSNQLDFIPKNLFRYNFVLIKANLHKNSLQTIHEDTFVNNIALMSVNLSSNQLDYLPANLFRKNNLLRYVDVSNNHLTYIGIDVTQFPRILSVDFSNNSCIGNADNTNLLKLQRVISSNCRSAKA